MSKTDLNQRTTDLYERIPGYPSPPDIPIPDISSNSSYREIGIEPGSVKYKLVKGYFKVSGFYSFCEELTKDNSISTYLRKVHLRKVPFPQSSVAASMALHDRHLTDNPIDKAVSLILAARSYYVSLRKGEIEPETIKDTVLEMGQYANLFSTNLYYNGSTFSWYKSVKTEFVTVLYRGSFYLVQMEGTDVSQTSMTKLRNALSDIIHNAGYSKTAEFSVGLLSSASHKVQRIYLNEMIKDKCYAGMEGLKHSFLTLCLDLNTHPDDYAETLYRIHNTNHQNRNFYSSCQLVVFGNAKAGMICHFSAYLDGNVMMKACSAISRMADKLLDQWNGKRDNSDRNAFRYRRVNFSDPGIDVSPLMNDVQSCMNNQKATFEISSFGRNKCIKYGCDPICVFGLALIKTAFDIEERFVTVKQLLTNAKFSCMGLVNMNLTTNEGKVFVRSLSNRKYSDAGRKRLLFRAIKCTKERMREARKGLDLADLYAIFTNTKQRVGVYVLNKLFKLLCILIGDDEFLTGKTTDIVISHPRIDDEVQLIGRPGTRLPYVGCFALHYQVYDDRTIITLMPGRNWKIPNEELIAGIEENLRLINRISAVNPRGWIGPSDSEVKWKASQKRKPFS